MLEQVGEFDRPTYVTSDPEDPDRLFVVEQEGRIQLAEGGSTTTFLDIEPIVHDLNPFGDYGLWSMAFSPDYATNHLFYVAYSGVDDPDTEGEDESGDWHIDEFSASGDTADPASRREVLTVKFPPSEFHYGGQLQFGPDGYLYASTGDGGPQGDPDGNAQNLQGLLGKILRIDPEGSSPGEYTVPTDNPFTDTAGCTDGCDEIWSYGLRHPWRFSFDRLTGDLVIGDVGWNLWEEIDFETGPDPGKGDNFGWNCREGAHQGPGESSPVCADRIGTFTEPVFEYPHVDPGPCSITGGHMVRDLALDDLDGRYLYADFCVGELRSLNLGLPTASGDRSEGLSVPLPTSFGEDADCRIYVASFDGPVYRLTEPSGGAGVGCQSPDTSIDSGPAEGSNTTDRRPTFEFSSTAPSSSFECRVDGGGYSDCASPHTADPLPDGEHTFEVRAISWAANPDPTPAARTFMVDTGPSPEPDPGPGPSPEPTPGSEPSPTPDGESEPGEPGDPGAAPLTLDLGARKQELKRRLRFFATASADSTLVATGKATKRTVKEVAANQKAKVKAKLRRAKRKRLQKKLDNQGKVKVKVEATATDASGAAAADTVKVKLRD
ncbi:MAG: PQQ-dependent sugar dehydrogenase [Solirubrobacterales bacterium]